MTDNREHLERLLTDAADGPISDADALRFARLARLLSSWRILDAGVDWSAQAGLVSAKIREEVEAQASARVDQLVDPTIPETAAVPGLDRAARDYRAVDDLLQSSASPLPPLDWRALSAKISAAVRREAEALQHHSTSPVLVHGPFRWVIRIGAPLAAAAVVALALWGSRPAARIAQNPHEHGRPTIKFALQEPEGNIGKVKITFDESRPKSMATDDAPLERLGIADGPRNGKTTGLPIDPALEP